MGRDGRVKLGESGEKAAERYLLQLGYTKVCRNYRVRSGQADLIFQDGETLVFCEVKTKRSSHSGHAAENYSKKQRDRLRRLILQFIQKSNWQGPLRVDVIALQKAQLSPHFEVHHYKDAISLEDNW